MKPFLSAVALATAATAAFSAEPEFRPWDEYRVVMWIGDSAWKQQDKLPLFWQRMREMGVNAGMVHGEADAKAHLDAKMPYYLENIVNRGLCLKWNSNVRDWDKFVTAWKDQRDEAGAVREYSFDDPAWLAGAQAQMAKLVKRHAPNAPLLYDIRDELSTTISANPFDYDFSPAAQGAFRTWLKAQYKSLDALNAQWETKFATWDDVKPFMTDQVKNRMASGDASPRGKPDWQAVQRLKLDPAQARKKPTAWNFSPWADHRTYMDVSLARTLDSLRKTSHALDPKTPVGIEGTQMPAAFGGYDLWRLSQVMDWVEPYDICDAREIFGSFMPGRTMLTTVGEQDARSAARRLWHLLLLGDRGCIIWWSEDCVDWKDAAYGLTPRAKALAPVFEEMKSPLARLFLRAKRESDPIAIHYSQPSVQAAWLLESTVDGSTWLRRFSSYEASHNRHARVRHAWLETLQDLGYSPQFVSSAQIERGELRKFRTLVMPQSWAISEEEKFALAQWITGSQTMGNVLADGTPGLFDGHCRLRDRSPLENEFPLSATPVVRSLYQSAEPFAADMVKVAAERVSATPNAAWYDWLAKHTGVPLSVKVPPTARVQTHRYQLGPVRLLAFERNISYAMDESLKQGGGNQELEKPIETTATLAAPGHVYDLRAGKYLGHTATIPLALDPWKPALFAVTTAKLPDGDVVAAVQKAGR